MEPLAQITSLFGEHYSEDGLKTIHGICSIKEGIILDIDNNIMRRNLLNGKSRILFIYDAKKPNQPEFTKKYLCRTYPAGHRFDSSNYSPVPAWSMGCQMVSLNFQTCDENMLLNKLMFEENGGINCGYVRKPEFLMMDTTKQENVDYLKEKYQEVNLILQVEIISAQLLETHTEAENEQAFPLVELSVHGQASDVQMNRGLSTKIYPNNQFHPIFIDGTINDFTKTAFTNLGIIEAKKHKPKKVESERVAVDQEIIEEIKNNANLNEAEVRYLSEKYRTELEEAQNEPQNPGNNQAPNPNNQDETNHPSEKELKKPAHSLSKYIIQLYYPEIAFVVFKVKDARSWYTLKLGGFAARNIRPGIRSVDLYDRQHAHDGFSSLLINIELL